MRNHWHSNKLQQSWWRNIRWNGSVSSPWFAWDKNMTEFKTCLNLIPHLTSTKFTCAVLMFMWTVTLHSDVHQSDGERCLMKAFGTVCACIILCEIQHSSKNNGFIVLMTWNNSEKMLFLFELDWSECCGAVKCEMRCHFWFQFSGCGVWTTGTRISSLKSSFLS